MALSQQIDQLGMTDSDFEIESIDFENFDDNFDIVELYCICGATCLESQDTSICCTSGKCNRIWFHRNCVGIVADDFFHEDVWICESCRTNSNKGDKDHKLTATVSTNTKKANGKKRKTAKLINDQLLYSEEEAIRYGNQHMLSTLKGMTQHPIIKSNEKLLLDARTIAEKLQMLTEPNECITELITYTWKTLSYGEGKSNISDRFETIYSTFHELATSDKVEACILKLIGNLGIEFSNTDTLLTQYLLNGLFLELLKHRQSKTDHLQPSVSKCENLDTEERQILYYTAGYICFKLLKHYRKCKNPTAKAYTSILKSWKLSPGVNRGDNFLVYAKKWIELVDRGGLFEISKEVLNFFEALEVIVKPILSVENMGNMHPDQLMSTLENDSSVLSTWEILVNKLENEQAKTSLFEKVVNCWIGLRVKAFARAYMFLRQKKDKKVCKKGEKSLRKKLKESTVSNMQI